MENPKEPIEVLKELIKLWQPTKKGKKLKTKIGFWLRGQFGFGREVWTIQDLNEEQIIQVIQYLNKKLNK